MNLSIRHSLLLYGILVTVLLLAGSLITWNSNVSLQRTEKEGQRIEHAMLAFKDVRYHVVQIQQFLTDAAAVGEADYTEAAREKTEALATLDSLAGLLPEERERVTGLKAAVETLNATGQRMADTYIREGREAGNAIMKAPGDGFDAAAEALSTQLQTMAADLHQREEDAEAAQTRTLNWMSVSTTAIAVVTLLLVLAANFVLYRVLMRMLGGEPAYAGQMAGHIAAGDLTQDIRLRTGDRESLLARISAMRDGLKDTVNAIRTGAEAVLEGTRQLDREAGQVVEGSRQQTDAASSVSSSVEELTVSIGQVADNAGSMNERALEAGRAAVQGGQEVRAATGEIRRVAESMQETARIIQSLGDESARITAIVDTIRGIAEQTNLLALNAAIEAARAGEQGRGFAVVADEVRKLAERTTLSTEEISAMVESIRHQALQSVQRMEENLAMAQQGVAQADKAYAAMDDVSRNADNTRADVEEMNATLQEQRSASASMARQVERIAQMVERNGAAVTRMAGELNKLERLSLDLESMVKRFRI